MLCNFYSILNFERPITDICKSCYFSIRNIYRIKKKHLSEHRKILVNALKKVTELRSSLN